MNNEILELLVHPKTQEAFHFYKERSLLVSKDSEEEFLFSDNVAYLLLPDSLNDIKKTELHERYKSDFVYKEHYQKDAEFFDYFQEYESNATNHENERLHQAIFRSIDRNYNTILDVGCGKGWVAKKGIKRKMKVLSMDVSTVNPLKVVKLHPSTDHIGLVADVYSLPVKQNSLDCIVASEIMEHVADPVKFVEILYSKLKKKGKLIITTPYNEQLEYNLCVHCNRHTPRHAHLHSFNEKNIISLIPEQSIWSYTKFSNHYLSKLKTHIILKFLPYKVWRIIDKLWNGVLGKQTRLMIEIVKQ